MTRLQNHLRKTFLAGIFAAVPVVVTGFIFWYADHHTRVISEQLFGRSIPLVGILVALAGIYLAGLVATTLLGKWIIALVDRLLSRLPGFKQLYAAWKQVALTPGGSDGMFARVVLIPDEPAQANIIGFTNGQSFTMNGTDGPALLCVFVPNAPNPLQGRVLFVERAKCKLLNTSAEEAFKVLLSTGNYLPPEIATPHEPAVASIS